MKGLRAAANRAIAAGDPFLPRDLDSAEKVLLAELSSPGVRVFGTADTFVAVAPMPSGAWREVAATPDAGAAAVEAAEWLRGQGVTELLSLGDPANYGCRFEVAIPAVRVQLWAPKLRLAVGAEE